MKKVEYVKVECHFWEIAKEHEESKCFFYLFDGGYSPVESLTVLASQFKNGKLYRRIEREFTWRDEVLEQWDDGVTLDVTVRELLDRNEQAVIGISHLVASMTDKPEENK